MKAKERNREKSAPRVESTSLARSRPARPRAFTFRAVKSMRKRYAGTVALSAKSGGRRGLESLVGGKRRTLRRSRRAVPAWPGVGLQSARPRNIFRRNCLSRGPSPPTKTRARERPKRGEKEEGRRGRKRSALFPSHFSSPGPVPKQAPIRLPPDPLGPGNRLCSKECVAPKARRKRISAASVSGPRALVWLCAQSCGRAATLSFRSRISSIWK